MLQNAVGGVRHSDEHAEYQDSEHSVDAEPGRKVALNSSAPDGMADEEPAARKQDQDQGTGTGQRNQHVLRSKRSIYRPFATITIPAPSTEEHKAKNGHSQRVHFGELAEIRLSIVRREVALDHFPGNTADRNPNHRSNRPPDEGTDGPTEHHTTHRDV